MALLMQDAPAARQADSSATTNGATTNADTPRLDLYAPVHKGLRAFMADTLLRVGRTDPDDAHETAQTLAQLQALLNVCRQHVVHENDFIHRAMERRASGAAALAGQEHAGHLAEIGRLNDLAATAAHLQGVQAAQAWHQLYHALSLFVAENYEHMLMEERDHNAVLWRHYTDAELAQLHDELLASIPPDEMALHFRWMLPQLSHAERVGMLTGARAGMPPEVFDAHLAQARALLDERDWRKLEAALQAGVPA